MKLISWNVNGFRAIVRKGFFAWLEQASPDVLCMQETRVQPDQLSGRACQPQGYVAHWHSGERKGYSGVATWSKIEPLQVQAGFGIDAYHAEGRVLITTYPGFKLLNIYFPNGRRDLERLEFKLQFYADLLEYCAVLLARGDRLVLCGDFNTAHRPIDLARPRQNAKTSGFMPEERVWIDRYLAHGFVDVFRTLHPDAEGQYTWWTYVRNARDRNVGWRIDYFLVSQSLLPAVTGAEILSHVIGSDHCPISLTLDPAQLIEGAGQR
jgi:exodeoxyribonuclease-3